MIQQLLTSVRYLWRDRKYSLLLATGVSVATASCILIGFFLNYHLSFDRFHEQDGKIAQVYQDFETMTLGGTGMKMGPMLVDEFPGLTSSTRIHQKGGLIRPGDEGAFPSGIREEEIIYVDSNYFEFFSFGLLAGQGNSVLSAPNQVVITEDKARMYFGSVAEAVGKTLLLDDQFNLTVTGVCKNVPQNSTTGFDLAISMATLNQVYNSPSFDSWWWPPVYTFVTVNQPEMLTSIQEDQLNDFARRNREEGTTIFPRLRDYSEIHLHGLTGEGGESGTVWLFGSIGLVILLLALINYVNLVTARGAVRALEVGVRKTLGANRIQLVLQFIRESWLICFIAVMASSLLVEAALPFFENLSGISVFVPWTTPLYWAGLFLISFILAVISGFYPAMILSAFSPSKAIKSQIAMKSGSGSVRKGLVAIQFVATVSLLVCTMIIYNQYEFLLKKNLGYDQHQLISINLSEAQTKAKLAPLVSEISGIPTITSIGASSWSPAGNSFSSFPVEITDKAGTPTSLENAVIIYADQGFLETLDLELIAGRSLMDSIGADLSGGFLINEEAAKLSGGTEQVLDHDIRMYYGEYGQILYEKKGQVKGVVKDFHVQSLRTAIQPIVITLSQNSDGQFNHLLVRLTGNRPQESLAAIGKAWEEIAGNFPFEFSFVEEEVKESYGDESTFGALIGSFGAIALLLASLGLLGLAAFTTRQKSKEIGIRKILGASSAQILTLLGKEFLVVLMVGICIAWGVAYYGSTLWLESYPYTREFSFIPYVLGALFSVGLVWGIILAMGWAELQKNPAESLRQE